MPRTHRRNRVTPSRAISSSFSEGTTVKIKKSRTKVQSKRNWSLREAEKAIKASPPANGMEVKLEWKERSITVNNIVAFQQDKAELTGTFAPPYADLALP